MKFVTDLGKGILGGPDSDVLWVTAISYISDEVLLRPNVRILVIACGHGTEAVILAKRMLALGISKEKVNESIYLIDKYHVFTSYIKQTYGFKNVITEDFLRWNTDMKFDVTLGNPPFRDSENKADRWSLWVDFVMKAWELTNDTGTVAMVSPLSWMAPGSDINQLIMKNAKVANLDAGELFDVGSTFSYYVLDRTPKNSITIISNGVQHIVDNSIKFLPQIINAEALSINEKTVLSSAPKFNFTRTTQHHTSNKHLFGTGPYKVFHTHAQTLDSTEKMPEHDSWKVMFTLSGYPTARVENEISCSQAVAWLVIPENEVTGAGSYFNGKLVQYLINANKWSGWNNLMVIKSIPKLDLSRSWTDQEIYDHFNLTLEEIAYVEANVK